MTVLQEAPFTVLEYLEHCSGTVFSLFTLVIRIINRIMICCYLIYYPSMLMQRFYLLILPNPGVQMAYNKYMSI
jgi:hypothetical protein